MAFKQSLVQRLFTISRISNQTLKTCRISSSSVAVQALIPPEPDKVAPDRGDETLFQRFLQRRPLYQSATSVPDLWYRPAGEKLMEKLRDMSNVRDRIRLEGLIVPEREVELTVEDARKVLKVSQLEMVKGKLRQTKKSCVTYDEFIQICMDGCWSEEQGLMFAKMLDDSGIVIVLGNVVFLKPEQVVKAIHGLMPVQDRPSPDSPIMKELEELEKVKFGIDKKAELMVRRELWAGLGFFVVQTAAFMRLTFWELSWDVMEPICFYVTSIYMMAGYAFFLRTSKEPSFEGFFQSRFNAKQKRLMKLRNFDIQRYNELRETCYPHPWPREKTTAFTSIDSVDNSARMKSFT